MKPLMLCMTAAVTGLSSPSVSKNTASCKIKKRPFTGRFYISAQPSHSKLQAVKKPRQSCIAVHELINQIRSVSGFQSQQVFPVILVGQTNRTAAGIHSGTSQKLGQLGV